MKFLNKNPLTANYPFSVTNIKNWKSKARFISLLSETFLKH